MHELWHMADSVTNTEKSNPAYYNECVGNPLSITSANPILSRESWAGRYKSSCKWRSLLVEMIDRFIAIIMENDFFPEDNKLMQSNLKICLAMTFVWPPTSGMTFMSNLEVTSTIQETVGDLTGQGQLSSSQGHIVLIIGWYLLSVSLMCFSVPGVYCRTKLV